MNDNPQGEAAAEAAKQGDRVLFNVVGRLEDGTVFSTTMQGLPVETVLGSGEVLPAVEMGLLGMRPGEQKRITVMASDAYGEGKEELIVDYPKQRLPQHEKFAPGQGIEMRTSDGNKLHAAILAVDEHTVKLDMNHPLAGKNLSYELQLISINGPSIREQLEEEARQRQNQQEQQAGQRQNQQGQAQQQR